MQRQNFMNCKLQSFQGRRKEGFKWDHWEKKANLNLNIKSTLPFFYFQNHFIITIHCYRFKTSVLKTRFSLPFRTSKKS